MQRRSFFGVLGGVAAFFGFKTETQGEESAFSQPVTNLPIIRFDEKTGDITNLGEIFKNPTVVVLTIGQRIEAVEAWLNEKDAKKFLPQWCEYAYCGPVFLRKVDGNRLLINPTPNSVLYINQTLVRNKQLIHMPGCDHTLQTWLAAALTHGHKLVGS